MYRVLAESVVGTRHRVAGAVNQDDVDHTNYVSPLGARHLVAVVADGAGTAPLGHVGARVATVAVRTSVCSHLADDRAFDSAAMRACTAHARDAVLAEACRRGVSERDLACTLLVAVVGHATALFGQLGDGAIVAGGSERGDRIFPAEPGTYANVTHFLTERSWRRHFRVVQTAAPDWFALLTDGIELLSIDPRTDTPVDGFFVPFVKAVTAAEDASDLVVPMQEFLDSPRVNACTDDDKTLLVAVRCAG